MPKTFPKYIILAMAALIVSVLGIDRMPQLTTIAALSLGYIWFVLHYIPEKDMQRKMIILFTITFFLQLSLSFFLYDKTVDTKYYGFSYKGDDYVYGDFGTIVGDLWRRGIFPNLKGLEHFNLIGEHVAPNKYQFYNVFIFYLFGRCGGQILLIINCFLHAAIVLPVYFIFKELNIKKNITVFAFCLFLFWPSTFYWSLFNFKEPVTLLVILTIFNLLMRMAKKLYLADILLISLLLYTAYYLKEYLSILLFAAILHIFIFVKWKHKDMVILAFLIYLLLRHIFVAPLFPNLYMLDQLPLTPYGARYSGRFANTSYFTNLITLTYTRTLLFLPFGIAATLFLPFLLRPFSIAYIWANVESIVWWCFIPFLVQGLWISSREDIKKMFPMIFTFTSWVVLLALTQSNMGTLLRQKSIIYYIGFIFIALSIDRLLSPGAREPGQKTGHAV